MGKRVYKFKKGDRPHLDDVYSIIGLIPNDAYHQDDIEDSDSFNVDNDNDAGESILFLKNVTLKVELNVS